MHSATASVSPRDLPVWKKLVFSGVILLVTLLILEGALRLVLGEPWYLRLVEQQALRVDTVRLGGRQIPLRAAPPAGPAQRGTYRVLFLGDSFTYGAGVDEAQATFVGRIEQRLNLERPVRGFDRYEVWNGGIPGSMTSQWVWLFERVVERVDPDLVVAVFFLRDGVAGVTSMRQMRAIRRELRAVHERSWLFRWSRIYRHLHERRLLSRSSETYLERLRAGYLGDRVQTQEWRRAQRNLVALRDGTRGRGAGFAVAIFPLLFELRGDYPLAAACDEIASFCRKQGVPVHSLLPAFMGRDAESLWVSPLNQHPNEDGHRIAADDLYDFVTTQMHASTP